jgi:cyclopropane fatty-acyl-phospholipid synthase-like methyltransferase
MKREFQIEFLKSVGLQPEHYLLDVGCGTLRGGIPIIEYLHSGHYYGTEVRAGVLEEARKELRESGLESKEPRLILTADVSSLDLERDFTFVWAYSVLIHLSDDILDDVLRFARRHLSKDGRFLANVNIGERSDSRWHQGFPLVWRSLEFYEHRALQAGLQLTDLGPIGSLGFKSSRRDHDQQHMLRFTRR